MPAMPPGEPAEEPFLRVVRYLADEKFSDQKIAARYTVAAASIGLPT
jgi:thioredoxin-related protein